MSFPPASLSGASRVVNEYFNWERVIDHVAAVVLVVLGRLHQTARIPSPGEQRVLSRLLRCKPIEFPTSPRMPPRRVQKFCIGPGLATISAYCDSSHVSLASPCSPGNRVDSVRDQGFVNTWSRDFGLQLHFTQRPPRGPFHPWKPSRHNPLSASNRETAHVRPGFSSAT